MPATADATGGGWHIRDARSDEDEAVARLTMAAYREYETVMTPTAWRGLQGAIAGGLAFRGPAERIVVEHEGVLVGSVMLLPATEEASLESVGRLPWPEVRLLAVAPAARGRGVGEALLHECVTRARSRGAARLGLHTSMSMQAAIRMYRRFGFVRVPEFDFQPPGAELVEAYALTL